MARCWERVVKRSLLTDPPRSEQQIKAKKCWVNKSVVCGRKGVWPDFFFVMKMYDKTNKNWAYGVVGYHTRFASYAEMLYAEGDRFNSGCVQYSGYAVTFIIFKLSEFKCIDRCRKVFFFSCGHQIWMEYLALTRLALSAWFKRGSSIWAKFPRQLKTL